MWGDIVGEAMKTMLLIGIVIGLGIAALAVLGWWVWSHLSIAWV